MSGGASSSTFEFRWFDYSTATADQIADILHVYEHVFINDIGLEFDPKLDADFNEPTKYYVQDVRGAYAVIVEIIPAATQDTDVHTHRERIVGTVGIRPICVPRECYDGKGGHLLPRVDDDGTTSTTEATKVCELKRMFLLPCARGKGLSKVMLQEVLQRAMALGFQAMVLDTKNRLEAANRLYETVGKFEDFTDYNGNPRPDRFMIRSLVPPQS